MGNLVNQAQIDASQISFSARFNEVFAAVEDPVRQLAMELPSTAATEQYNWLGVVPGLTEWLDDRKLSTLKAEGFTIVNRDWSNGIRVHRNDIRDDRLGLVRPRIDDLARKAALHYGQLLGDYLVDAFAGALALGYDGKALCVTDHPNGSLADISNKATAALADASYDAGRAAMQGFIDENGDNLGIVPTHLVVGPSNERTALQTTQAGVISDGSGAGITNVFAGTARVIVSPKLVGAYANYWFLCDLSQAFKPLILQIREPVTFSAMDDPNSLPRFMRKELLYGAEGAHAVGPGLWQCIYGSDGTT